MILLYSDKIRHHLLHSQKLPGCDGNTSSQFCPIKTTMLQSSIMTDLAALSLMALVHHCQYQTERFWQGLPSDVRYCHALFARALAEPATATSKQAWDFIHHTYRPQVIIWVKHHTFFPATAENPDTLADLALQKMWLAFAHDPQKLSRFPPEAESCLPKLLRYLQMCVDSVIKDILTKPIEEPLSAALHHLDDFHSDSEAIWDCLDARLHDERERLVVDASFMAGLKPRQIYTLYGDLFRDVQEIYRMKENVLARFRRDASLQDCLERTAVSA